MKKKITQKEIIQQFSELKILVVGDILLDLYIHGKVERISPEAPVPVVLEHSRKYILGGAGNVAANIAALGAAVTLAGVCGDDAEGKVLYDLCRHLKISTGFLKSKERPTTLKTRAVVERHQLLRIDREVIKPISLREEIKLNSLLKKLPDFDLVVLSDYAKGCLTKNIIDALKKRFGKEKIVVGLKPSAAKLFHGVRVWSLNLKEAQTLIGIYATAQKEAALVVKEIARRYKTSVILTRGEYGLTVYDEKKKKIAHFPTRAQRVYDVTGAGDTVLAVASLLLASGAPLAKAAAVANQAAGVVVSIEGTATLSKSELAGIILES